MSDFLYGTANARYSILRFGFRASHTGLFSVGFYSSATVLAISFPINITVANVDTEFSFVVPPATTGTWPTTAKFAGVYFSSSTSASFQQAPYAWLSSSKTGVTGMPTTITSGDTFDVFDVGWYLDPNMTGVAPEFQGNHVEDDLQDCLRYWYPAYCLVGGVNTATQGIGWSSHYVPMYIIPTASLVGTVRCYDLSVSPAITSISNYNSNPEMLALLINANAFTLGRAFKTLVDAQTANYIAVDARMT